MKNKGHAGKLLTGAALLTAVALTTPGCSGGGGGDTSSDKKIEEPAPAPTPTPVNHIPTFTNAPNTEAVEGEVYTTFIDVADADGDVLDVSVVNAPGFLGLTKINNTRWALTGTPEDEDSGKNSDVTLRVSDGKATNDLAYILNVENTEPVSGNVNSYFPGEGNLQGIKITLDGDEDREAITDVNGNFEFDVVRDGNYQVTLEATNAIYQTHEAGTLISSKEKGLAGKLNDVNFSLYKKEYQGFVDETARAVNHGNKIVKWPAGVEPIWDIYKLEAITGQEIPEDKINLVEDALKTEIAEFYQQPITDANINLIPTKPFVGQPADRHVKIYWNHNIPAGVNTTYFSENDIISGYVSLNPNVGQAVILSEIGEILIGSGESDLYPSVLNSAPTLTQLSVADEMLSNIVYGERARPAGNITLDENPFGYVINE